MKKPWKLTKNNSLKTFNLAMVFESCPQKYLQQKTFKKNFSEFFENKGYTLDGVFHTDETGTG